MTKKLTSISSPKYGKFVKVAGQYLSRREDRNRIEVGCRFNYQSLKNEMVMRVSKIAKEGQTTQTFLAEINKKDLRKLVKLLKFAIKYNTRFLEEEDNLE